MCEDSYITVMFMRGSSSLRLDFSPAVGNTWLTLGLTLSLDITWITIKNWRL